ncbi:MAG TPA: hypothetical protein VFX98_02805 [Longimicrobiaceae bacterium]|nr:hypothetical protein [Longimicrobiaceae bacterium]
MSQLVEVLHPLPDLRRTPLSSLRWWESRRLLFNKVVGATGLVTLSGVSVFFMLMGEFSVLPMIAVAAAYGVAANVYYTLGWLIELVARAAWGRQAPDLGPLLFRYGLIFSVGLTRFPLLLVALLSVVQIVLAIG